MFRYKKAMPIPYEQQGYIYFTSRMYQALPLERQQQIRELCREAGGEYAEAIFDFVTTDTGAVAVCGRHHLSEKTLERAVLRYYLRASETI